MASDIVWKPPARRSHASLKLIICLNCYHALSKFLVDYAAYVLRVENLIENLGDLDSDCKKDI